jgi:methanogenic corrinoid protein MtbC1
MRHDWVGGTVHVAATVMFRGCAWMKGAPMAHGLVEAMADMKEQEALRLVDDMLAEGEDPGRVLALASEAMQVVGERYQEGTYFLPELIMAGEMMKKIGEVVKPLLATRQTEAAKLGKVVLGTVRGDIHDIGKDIVGFMLEVNGFEVVDLGIDQPEANFVEAVKEYRPQVLALSGFLSVAFDSMKSTIDEVENAGLRDGLRVIIGGGQMDDTVRKYTGADAYGDDAMAAVAFAKEAVGA